MIKGILNAWYFVRDMGRAVVFYRDVLGLRLEYQSRWWTSFDLGGVRLGLHWDQKKPGRKAARQPRGGATVTFRVADAHETYRELKRRGVKLVGKIHEQPWGDMGSLEDPEGNLLQFMRAAR